jgi:glycosyltransferase involved in cell wall biosynthesis
MAPQYLVSVIIPCYNVSAFVEKAVGSIIEQSYKNIEIWIIDDASTDDTLEKIQAIKDERIKIVTFLKNTKKIGAVNEVLQKVNGTLIAFQDADDWSEPNRISEQVNCFRVDPGLGICFTGFLYGNRKYVNADGMALTSEELKYEFLNFGNKNKSLILPVCASMMISKEVLKVTHGYNTYFKGRVAEDIHWVYRILKHYRGKTIDLPLYHVQINTGSLTSKQFSGENAKAAYSWQLLSKIIYKDIHEDIDVLDPGNINILKMLELEACEEALVENIQLVNEINDNYKNSMSFKIGKFILSPWHLLKSLKK